MDVMMETTIQYEMEKLKSISREVVHSLQLILHLLEGESDKLPSVGNSSTYDKLRETIHSVAAKSLELTKTLGAGSDDDSRSIADIPCEIVMGLDTDETLRDDIEKTTELSQYHNSADESKMQNPMQDEQDDSNSNDVTQDLMSFKPPMLPYQLSSSIITSAVLMHYQKMLTFPSISTDSLAIGQPQAVNGTQSFITSSPNRNDENATINMTRGSSDRIWKGKNCVYCNKAFTRSCALLRHLKEKHFKTTFTCFYCDIVFKTIVARTEHIKEVHPDERKSTVCPLCCADFSSSFGKCIHLAYCTANLARSQVTPNATDSDKNATHRA